MMLAIRTLIVVGLVPQAALLAAAGPGDPPLGLAFRLIAAPHEALERGLASTSRFAAAPLLELDGEKG